MRMTIHGRSSGATGIPRPAPPRFRDDCRGVGIPLCGSWSLWRGRTSSTLHPIHWRPKTLQVGPRDGLQNEATPIPTATKVELIERLAAAGLPVVEATSFVSPKWVPQLADAAQVLAQVLPRPGVRYPVLTPNMKVRGCCVSRACYCRCPAANLQPAALGRETASLRPAAFSRDQRAKNGGPPACSTHRIPAPTLTPCPTFYPFYTPQGLENALAAGSREVAIFTAASEAFNRANTNVGIDDSLRRLADVAAAAQAEGVTVRGYVSCVVGCPYQVTQRGRFRFVGVSAVRPSGSASVWRGSCAARAQRRPPLPAAPDAGRACPLLQPTGSRKDARLAARHHPPSFTTLHPPPRPAPSSQGHVPPQEAARVAQALDQMGCYQVSMGDTTGVGTPASVAAMFEVGRGAWGVRPGWVLRTAPIPPFIATVMGSLARLACSHPSAHL